MAKRTRYTEYHDRYPNYRLELTDDGILFMQCLKQNRIPDSGAAFFDMVAEPAV